MFSIVLIFTAVCAKKTRRRRLEISSDVSRLTVDEVTQRFGHNQYLSDVIVVAVATRAARRCQAQLTSSCGC